MKGMLWQEMERKTDWTAYYKGRKSWLSAYTQKFTFQKILYVIDRYLETEVKTGLQIAELGGGNSCFAGNLCNARNIHTYHIIDNNELSVDLFNKMKLNAKAHYGIRHDLLEAPAGRQFLQKYDFVFSIGLIEHFREKNIETVIRRHYEYCKCGGIVMISFPTPTRKYRAIRTCMEAVGAWQFYDERPIRYEEIQPIFEKNGIVQEHFINNKLPLSQTIVISRNDKTKYC